MEYVFLIFGLIAFFLNNHRLLFSLIVVSMVAEAIRFNLVGSMLLSNVVGFMVIPYVLKNWKKIPSLNGAISFSFLIQINVIILFLIFSVLFPWQDLSGYRAWGQQSFGRGLITMVRLFNEFMLFYYIILLFTIREVTIRFFLKLILVMTIISFVVAFLDKFNGYIIVDTLFYFRDDLVGRFVGLNGEPKVFGRANALAFGIVLIFKNEIKFRLPLLVLTTIGAFISLSASSIIMYFIFFGIIIIYRNRKKVSHITLFFLLIIGITFFAPNVLELIPNQYGTIDKIKQVLGEEDSINQKDWISNESYISKRFDIFDRLALIYLFENPKYLIFGVGPNLISIPASKYIPQNNLYAEEKRIDSVPNNFINNTIASGGVIYLLIWNVFLWRIFSFLKKDEESVLLFFIAIILNMVFFSSSLYILLAISIGMYIEKMRQEAEASKKLLDA